MKPQNRKSYTNTHQIVGKDMAQLTHAISDCIHPATTNTTTILFVALIHGLIDLSSALVIYNCATVHNLRPETAAAYTILYDITLFALHHFSV